MKKVAVFYFLKVFNESGDFHQFKIKEYKDDNCSTIFFSFYQGKAGFPRYFSEGKLFQDEKHLRETRDKIVYFLWKQFKYQSKHSRKMSAVYFALLFDLESKKDDFDKNAFHLKIKTLYEQNSYRRNLNFSSFSEFECFLFNNFLELEDYIKYFLLITQRLETEIEKHLFVNACACFVESFREIENIDLKMTLRK